MITDKKTLKKFIVPIIILSLGLNLFLVFHYYQERNKRENDLSDAADYLSDLDKDHPDYKNHLIAAQRNFAENRGWIDAHVRDMPQNLVSWNGGMEVGLGNGVYGVNEAGVKETVKDIVNFKRGYDKEAQSIDPISQPHKALKVIEDVLSSKEYMGDN